METNAIAVKRDNKACKVFFDLDKDTRRLLEYKLMCECEWAYTTMIHKMKGHLRIRKPEIPIVMSCFAEVGIIDPYAYNNE